MSLGLYIHVPFCSAICNYCTFNRGLFDHALKTEYVAAVLKEIERAAEPVAADTIFFGGGTPSLLEPEEIGAIVDACRAGFVLSGDAEVTLEANPESATLDRLARFRAAGINRLSFGVQSFSDAELQRLSRLHSAGRAREAFAAAREAGFDNISLDLMMWLPQQTIAEWLTSVDGLIALGPEHASLYLLEIYPNSPLRDAMTKSKWAVAADDDAAEMYLLAMERLDAAGYEQYEISNVARNGVTNGDVTQGDVTQGDVTQGDRVSRHNLKYWTDGEWLGFGPGAHSTRGGVRWRNVSATPEYIGAVQAGGQLIAERRILSRQDGIEEALFTRLRLTEGIDLELVKSRYDLDVWRQYGGELKRFVEAGLLIYDERRLKLTRAGMLLANEIMTVFLGSHVR